MQEVEIDPSFDHALLRISGFSLELENNCTKMRTGINIKTGVHYKRRIDLEGLNSHLVVIDIGINNEYRIINLYRSFNPINTTAKNHFKYQVELLSKAIDRNTIIVGDFNLDYFKFYDEYYAHALLCEYWDTVITAKSLIQQINFTTWSRAVNNVFRSSTIDHLYSKDPTKIINLNKFQPPFGDHVGICFEVHLTKTTPLSFFKRDWRFYNVDVLCNELKKVMWPKNVLKVQDYWNHFESSLLQVVDKLLPYKKFENNFVKCTQPPSIKNKIDKLSCLFFSAY